MDISKKDILRTRFVTPKEIIEGVKDPAIPNKSVSNILFNARYKAGKALLGYDFTDGPSYDDDIFENKTSIVIRSVKIDKYKSVACIPYPDSPSGVGFVRYDSVEGSGSLRDVTVHVGNDNKVMVRYRKESGEWTTVKENPDSLIAKCNKQKEIWAEITMKGVSKGESITSKVFETEKGLGE